MSTRHSFSSTGVQVFPKRLSIGIKKLLLSVIYLTQLGLCTPKTSSAQTTTLQRELSNQAGTFFIPLQRLASRSSSPPFGGLVTLSSPSQHSTKATRRRSELSATVPAPIGSRNRRGLAHLASISRVGYAGQVLIGTPPQRFPMLFDTGSDLALVTSDACVGDECQWLLHYSCTASSTCTPLSSDNRNRGGKTSGGTSSAYSLSLASPPSPAFIDVGSDVQGLRPSKSFIPITAKVPLGQTHPTAYYNQSYVDGSWGVGYFVQDRFQIDGGTEAITTTTAQEPSAPPFSSSSPTLQADNHPTLMTFLNVVQDNLDLVHGYDGQIAGLLGLSRASPTGHKTFLEAMVSQGSLAQPIMSMHLEDDGGSFLLGGVDSQGFVGDTLYYSPVSDPIDWQISLFGLGTIPRGFASQSSSLSSPPSPPVSSSSSPSRLTSSKPIQKNITPNVDSIPDPDRVLAHIPAILDSGASAILAPLRASEVLHRHLGGYRDIVHPDLWMLPCEGPDMVWWLAEVGIVQPYEALIHKLQDGRCQSLIFESADLDFWVLGDTWLRGLYIAYDMAGQGRIGIAVARRPEMAVGDHKAEGYDGEGAGQRQNSRVWMIPRVMDRALTQAATSDASQRSMGMIGASVWGGVWCWLFMLHLVDENVFSVLFRFLE